MVVYIIYRLSRLKVNFPGRKPINPEASKITCMCRGETALLVSFYILSDFWALVIYLPWNGTRRGTSRDSPFELRETLREVLNRTWFFVRQVTGEFSKWGKGKKEADQEKNLSHHL